MHPLFLLQAQLTREWCDCSNFISLPTEVRIKQISAGFVKATCEYTYKPTFYSSCSLHYTVRVHVLKMWRCEQTLEHPLRNKLARCKFKLSEACSVENRHCLFSGEFRFCITYTTYMKQVFHKLLISAHKLLIIAPVCGYPMPAFPRFIFPL